MDEPFPVVDVHTRRLMHRIPLELGQTKRPLSKAPAPPSSVRAVEFSLFQAG